MTNPNPGAATDVGARLREAREARDLSLRLVADRTHISVMALEALERSDLKRLPGGIFTRAFLRAYASEVGLDPECTVRDFLAQFPHDAESAIGPHGQVEDGEAVENDRLMAQTVVRLVAVSLPLAGALVYLGMRSPGAASVADLVGQPAAVVRAADAGAVGLRLLEEPAPASAGAAPEQVEQGRFESDFHHRGWLQRRGAAVANQAPDARWQAGVASRFTPSDRPGSCRA